MCDPFCKSEAFYNGQYVEMVNKKKAPLTVSSFITTTVKIDFYSISNVT